MTSIERIAEYCELPSEAQPRTSRRDDPNWPSRGQITFTDVTMRYDAMMPFALQDITFTIEAGQKVPSVCLTVDMDYSHPIFLYVSDVFLGWHCWSNWSRKVVDNISSVSTLKVH
jgi:hypothetical protein